MYEDSRFIVDFPGDSPVDGQGCIIMEFDSEVFHSTVFSFGHLKSDRVKIVRDVSYVYFFCI